MSGLDGSGRFEQRGLLGQGGMGRVVRAFDRALGREVALKLMPIAGGDAARLERFRREGEAAARLDHSGIVPVHGSGVVGNDAFLVYQLVEGARPLDQAFKEAGLEQRVGWVLETARALAHAHERGVVHRDVKPANVLVDARGRVRVTDFGLARATGFTPLTRTGALLGTPFWLAPEAFEQRGTDPTVDVWALGVLLYEALVGVLPFQGQSLPELWQRITGQAPVPPRELDPHLPAALETVCLRALEKRPEDRPRDAGAFAELLAAALGGERLAAGPRARRARWALVGALGLLLPALGVGGALALRGGEPAPAAPTPTGPGGAEGTPAQPAPAALVEPGGDPTRWRLAAGQVFRSRLAFTGKRVEVGTGTAMYDFVIALHFTERVVLAGPDAVELELELTRFQSTVTGSGWAPLEIDTLSERLSYEYVARLIGLKTRLAVDLRAGRVRCVAHEDQRIDQVLAEVDEMSRNMLLMALDTLRGRMLERRLELMWCLDPAPPGTSGSWERERDVWAFSALGLAVQVRFRWADGQVVGRGTGARTLEKPPDLESIRDARVQLATRWGRGRLPAGWFELHLEEDWTGRPATEIDWRIEYAQEE